MNDNPTLGGGHYTCEKCGILVTGSALHHCEISNAVIKELNGLEPSVIDKSIMVKLTPREIQNMVEMGARYWSNAQKNGTTKTLEYVCEHHFNVAMDILKATDPDRFIYSS